MSDEKLLVKLAGGAAAQTLGLINAIFVKNRLNRSFRVRHYPHSTGTYWPLAIGFLLKPEELENSGANIRNFIPEENLEVGKIIRSHPLESRVFSWEEVLKIIRRIKLEYFFRRINGEIAIEAKPHRLERVGFRTKAMSGGFVPILDEDVMTEMDLRFKSSGKQSPFSKDSTEERYIAIHYRIGDKRTKFTVDSDFGGDGIFDPARFKELIALIDPNDELRRIVLSDEPKVAQDLLNEVGIKVELPTILNDIWNDLYVMSQADVLLGSWSQVSQLAAICVSFNGGKAYLPNTTLDKIKVHWSIPRVEFFSPSYLGNDHPIYKPDFSLSDDSHKGYKNIR